MADKITYGTKTDRRTSNVPATQKVTAANLNEIKEKFNALVDEVDNLPSGAAYDEYIAGIKQEGTDVPELLGQVVDTVTNPDIPDTAMVWNYISPGAYTLTRAAGWPLGTVILFQVVPFQYASECIAGARRSNTTTITFTVHELATGNNTNNWQAQLHIMVAK